MFCISNINLQVKVSCNQNSCRNHSNELTRSFLFPVLFAPVLPVRRRVQVRPARLQDLRQERRRHHRLQRVHLRVVHHISGQLRTEAQLGLQHVRPGRRRQDHTGGDAGDHRGISPFFFFFFKGAAKLKGDEEINYSVCTLNINLGSS